MSINPESKINPDVFQTDKLAQVATRDGYGEGVVQAGEEDENVVVLCADLTESTRNLEFKKLFPDRFIQCGVHEQFLAAGGAGFAMAGKVPFISSYAMFCPGRAWEQVRTNICLNEANVKIAGAHAGVSVGQDGATHQAIEDIAIMRVIPKINILVPCDAIETKKAILAVAKAKGPFYVRFARNKSPVFTTQDTPFKIGKAEILNDGDDIAIIACGPLVHEAMLAAYKLERRKISVRVINMHTIKPIDEDTILSAAEGCGAIVTVEEHQVIGGLGSAVAEILSKNRPTPMEMIGIQDEFGQSGEPCELLEHFKLTAPHIVEASLRVMARKN